MSERLQLSSPHVLVVRGDLRQRAVGAQLHPPLQGIVRVKPHCVCGVVGKIGQGGALHCQTETAPVVVLSTPRVTRKRRVCSPVCTSKFGQLCIKNENSVQHCLDFEDVTSDVEQHDKFEVSPVNHSNAVVLLKVHRTL